jgi:hypothetical protein
MEKIDGIGDGEAATEGMDQDSGRIDLEVEVGLTGRNQVGEPGTEEASGYKAARLGG